MSVLSGILTKNSDLSQERLYQAITVTMTDIFFQKKRVDEIQYEEDSSDEGQTEEKHSSKDNDIKSQNSKNSDHKTD